MDPLGTLAHLGHGSAGTDHLDLAVFFAIGLLAGAHCLGMCGPLVTAYADRIAVAGRRDHLTVAAVRQHVLFNLGRAASYALLGALFGLLGAAMLTAAGSTPALDGALRAGLGVLVGVAIMASGTYYLRGRAGVPGHGLPVVGGLLERLTGVVTRRIDRLATGPGIVLLGGVHGLFPCPIIYPAYLYALALGDPLRGALALGVLGLGTIPTLLAYGTVVGGMSVRSRVSLHRALGVAFIVLGYVPLQHGLMTVGIHLPHPPIPFYQPL